MRDLKTLQELVASITDWEAFNEITFKPFVPKLLDVALWQHAPQFYSEEQFAQINHFSKLHLGFGLRSREKNTRKRPISEMSKEEDMPENQTSRKKIKIKHPSPKLSIEFENRVNELNGGDITFLMQKKLYRSDLDTNKNRLSMPRNEIRCDFLTETEIAKLKEREGTSGKGKLVGVEVHVLDPCLREFTLLLKKWDMENTYTLNLSKHWNNVVSTNKFEENQELYIWTFRVDEKLYFLLNRV
uniref:B3 domain-containing protein At1g05920 family n=1 Tax=Cajanus cajan TaxID=3821 RepID=A0A151SZQ5_CAJCA|nr:B3 domain-containing protein At1g05920 family [Cajanus cajan]